MSLLELFCAVDDFWMEFAPQWERLQVSSGRERRRAGDMHESEIMSILIYFHQMRFRDFKTFYTRYVMRHLSSEFPKLVSYNRFVELMPRVLLPLCAYLHKCYGRCTGISFVDSTALAVCDNHRIKSHKVFSGLAARGKTSMGWFYGFKVHLLTNDLGELLGVAFSAGNVDDRVPLPALCRRLFGKLFGDKGYLSATLSALLLDQFGVQLITKLRKNMKNRLLPLMDKLLLRKRSIMETIIDQLKNISQIEHTRHRSPVNFLVNLIAGLIAYSLQPNKPSLGISRNALSPIATA